MTHIQLAIIGGTGLTQLDGLEITHRQVLDTPYGAISAPILHGHYRGYAVAFLARHGAGHTIPPHKINYRANLWALKSLGINTIIAAAAVGSIHPQMQVGELVIPHQLIDYTWSREHTFFSDFNSPTEQMNHLKHIDFSSPYCERLRHYLLQAAKSLPFTVHSQGVYGATQGPRLETIAEINRMARDGCDLVGMTGMPEAALARELELCYATCAVVANPAAGRGNCSEISMSDIETALALGMSRLRDLFTAVLTTKFSDF
jgi:5'-methylthioinosine phosphorylase